MRRRIEINKQTKQKWLDAIEEMERWYRKEKGFELLNCPLCDVALDNKNEPTCRGCLWIKYEGHYCDEEIIKKIFFIRFLVKREISILREKRPRWWRGQSLKRLARWRKLLEENND